MSVEDTEGNKNLPIYYGNVYCRGKDVSLQTEVAWLVVDVMIEGPRQKAKPDDVKLKVV